MRVRVLFFGILKDMLGAAERDLDLLPGATAGDVLAWLGGRVEAGGLLRSVAVAVNQEYATASTVLREDDELALLPPVSGGGGPALYGFEGTPV